MRMTINNLADDINEDCDKRKYFWAVGLVKETIVLWQTQANFELLCPIAQHFANHYLTEQS